jgi:F0F1-type ATP synthase assembly protein I
MFPSSGDQKDLGRLLAMGQVGMEMAAPIALGAVIDSYFRSSPWAVLVGAAIGFIGGFTHLVRMAGSPPTQPRRDRTPPSDDDRPGGTQ